MDLIPTRMSGARLRKAPELHELEAKLKYPCSGEAFTVELSGPVATGRFSRVYMGRAEAFEGTLAVKVCLGPDGFSPSADAARACFEAMRALHEITARDPRLGSPRPYGWSPSAAAVVAEWVDGQGFARLLKRRRTAVRAAGDAGAWLGWFAQASGYERRPLEIENMLRGLPGDGPPVLQRAVAALRNTADVAGEREVVWAAHFGDFKPANMLLRNDGKIYGLDSGYPTRGPAVVDAAQFLNHAALMRVAGNLREIDAELEPAFLHGYEGDSGLELPAFQLAWVRLFNAVHLASGHQIWSRPPRRWVLMWLAGRLLTVLTDRLVPSTISAWSAEEQS